MELCKTLLSNFLANYHTQPEFLELLGSMIKRLTQLVYVNEKNQQRLLIQLFNLIINQKEVDEKALYLLFFCEEYQEDRVLTLEEVLNNPIYKDNGAPFY